MRNEHRQSARFAGLVAMFLLSLSAMATQAAGGVYYVSNAGNDANDGRTAESAWRTIACVNRAAIAPGARILFRRGDHWREQLRPHSGSEGAHITYGAYGEGAKPLLLGSLELNEASDWHRERQNVWATPEPASGSGDVLATVDGERWHLHTEGGAAARAEGLEGGNPQRVHCKALGTRGSHMQFYTGRFAVAKGTLYRFTCRIKSTAAFALAAPLLMQAQPPWGTYAAPAMPREARATNEWLPCTWYYRADTTAEDARLAFFLGDTLPVGATLGIADAALVECTSQKVLTCDVGNIIFDGEAACGVKVWNEADLDTQGEFWYDEAAHVLKLYSADSPATYYADIECAMRAHIIDDTNTSWVIIENLALKYGGAHGIGGTNTHHLIVRDCDIAYIGGGDQRGGEHTVRYGNGIEFWSNAHDNLVERCRLWEIYDAALTNQGSGTNKQYSITYRNNLIWNCEYSFEYWNRTEKSETRNIRFEHNTCVNAGHGWGHTQRADPSGRQLCFYTSPAAAEDIILNNNIFFEAKSNAFYAPTWSPEAVKALRMDHNCWYQAEGTMIRFGERSYTQAQFAAYQSDYGQEPHSIVADPRFANIAQRDLRLTEESPCVDAGVLDDCKGNLRPKSGVPDIGAYEYAK